MRTSTLPNPRSSERGYHFARCFYFFSRAVFRAAPQLTERVKEATCIDERLAKRQGKNLEPGHLNNVNRTLHFYLNELSELSELSEFETVPGEMNPTMRLLCTDMHLQFFFFPSCCRSHSVCQITVERTRCKGSVKPAAEGRKAVNNSVLVFLEYRFLNTYPTGLPIAPCLPSRYLARVKMISRFGMVRRN